MGLLLAPDNLFVISVLFCSLFVGERVMEGRGGDQLGAVPCHLCGYFEAKAVGRGGRGIQK